ncbi:MAG: MbtH family protein [Labedaea sp.]
MITNPFDGEAGLFLVLVNARGQHSLWPSELPAPAGWTVAFGADARAACLNFVRANEAGNRRRSAPAPRQAPGGAT